VSIEILSTAPDELPDLDPKFGRIAERLERDVCRRSLHLSAQGIVLVIHKQDRNSASDPPGHLLATAVTAATVAEHDQGVGGRNPW
jgi:hypothetical protein